MININGILKFQNWNRFWESERNIQQMWASAKWIRTFSIVKFE